MRRKTYTCYAIKCESLEEGYEGYLISAGWSLSTKRENQAVFLYPTESIAEKQVAKYRKKFPHDKLSVVEVKVSVTSL